jgi:hypothetical protein
MVAKAVGVSLRAVQRIREANRLQPLRVRTFKTSKARPSLKRSTIEPNTPHLRRRRVSFAKKPSTALSHEGGRGVVEHEARMTLMRPAIVEDDVNDPADRNLGFDSVQEADEFLVPITLHAAPDDLAVEHIEGGKQGGGAVAVVDAMGAAEHLDLRFLLDREHDGMRRRIEIKPDDVAQLGGELRIGGQLELAHPMRLQTVGAPDALHRGDADPSSRGHHAGGPVGPLAARILLGQCDHPFSDLRPKGGMREGRVLSRNSPVTPSCMNRSCQRQTQVLLLPVQRMISTAPSSAAVNRMIRARQTCFCVLFRSATIEAKRP